MPQNRLTYLLERQLAGACTPAEKQELAALALEKVNQPLLHELISDSWEITGAEEDMPGNKAVEILHGILRPAKIKRIIWQRFAVAASVLLVMSAGGYYLFFNKSLQPKNITVATANIKAPETNRATITLSNGKVVYLDSLANGEIAVQGNINLVKQANGEIAYQSFNGTTTGQLQYNTLFNPRGSKVISMVLSDGSKVWLNAGSSVTYPVAFINNERKIDIAGEAYFEIMPDKIKPFSVVKNNIIIRVLGTRFNVNAYDDEEQIKVTLLQGAVGVKKDGETAKLVPGQQAIVSQAIKIVNDSDTGAVMAWKNGRFQFAGEGIEEIMRQLSRWYNIEVVYEAKPAIQHFRGGISRGVEVSKVLKMLELTGAVHFRTEGKKVIVIR